MKITFLIDIKDSIFHEFINKFILKLNKKYNVKLINNINKIEKGDILILIGCKTILKKKHLALNNKNFVVHPSKLPKGKGSAAIVWSVLNGDKRLYISIFEPNEKIDAGPIYIQDYFTINDTDLSDNIRKKQVKKTFNLIEKLLKNLDKIKPKKQKKIKKNNFFRKRFPKDSELNINESIKKQINKFRVSDNERYPSFFYYKGKKFILKIYHG